MMKSFLALVLFAFVEVVKLLYSITKENRIARFEIGEQRWAMEKVGQQKLHFNSPEKLFNYVKIGSLNVIKN